MHDSVKDGTTRKLYVTANEVEYRNDRSKPNDPAHEGTYLSKGQTFWVTGVMADDWALGTCGEWTSGDLVYVRYNQLSTNYVQRCFNATGPSDWERGDGYILNSNDLVKIHTAPSDASPVAGAVTGYVYGVEVLETSNVEWIHLRISFNLGSYQSDDTWQGNGYIMGYVRQEFLKGIGGTD